MFKFALQYTSQNKTVSNEGLMDSLAYAFSSEAKIAEKLVSLKKKLSDTPDEQLATVQVTSYKYEQLLRVLDICKAVAKVSEPILEKLRKYTELYDNDAPEEECESQWDVVCKAMESAGKALSSSKQLVEKTLDTKKTSGTLGYLGFTSDRLAAIISGFEKTIVVNKKIYDELDGFNSDVDMPALSWGNDALTLYMQAVSVAASSFRTVDMFLFTLERKLHSSK